MYKRGSKWWVSIRHEGRKIQRSLETSNKEIAVLLEAKIRYQIISNTYDKNIGKEGEMKKEIETIIEGLDTRLVKDVKPKLVGTFSICITKGFLLREKAVKLAKKFATILYPCQVDEKGSKFVVKRLVINTDQMWMLK